DCILIDGGYPQYLDKVIEYADNRGSNINIESFCFPFRNFFNKNLTAEQANFNKQLGSIRSQIESYF
ncbi:hypothetical protein BDF14DRAFT_1709313, partial [Spinellus fusiger]